MHARTWMRVSLFLMVALTLAIRRWPKCGLWG